jgi:hypothetical protein
MGLRPAYDALSRELAHVQDALATRGLIEPRTHFIQQGVNGFASGSCIHSVDELRNIRLRGPGSAVVLDQSLEDADRIGSDCAADCKKFGYIEPPLPLRIWRHRTAACRDCERPRRPVSGHSYGEPHAGARRGPVLGGSETSAFCRDL